MKFEVSADIDLISNPFKILIRGANPFEKVTIASSIIDGDAILWKSWGKFKANKQGIIDLSVQAPLEGSYEGIDSMGLIWSMSPVKKKNRSVSRVNRFVVSDLTSLTIKFDAFVDGKKVASKSIERVIKKPEIIAKLIRGEGFYGWLYREDHNNKRPGILLVSDHTGLNSFVSIAALLASYGYVVFVIAYTNYLDLPKECYEIPLEIISSAANFLKQYPLVNSEKVAGIGYSSGAELLLSAVSYMPDINLNSLILYSPSCVIWQGRGSGKIKFKSSWSYKGNSLPFISIERRKLLIRKMLFVLSNLFGLNKIFKSLKNFNLVDLYRKALDQDDLLGDALIPISNVKAPILMISGKDDLIFPSEIMASIIIDELNATDFNYECKNFVYEDAGHFIGLPGVPIYLNSSIKIYGATFKNGGKEKENFNANVDAWSNMLKSIMRK